MAFTEIDLATIKPTDPRERYPIPPQHGPLRWYDTSYRCASRGCGSPTRYKLNGVPYCSVHVIRKMNDMICELTGEEYDADSY